MGGHCQPSVRHTQRSDRRPETVGRPDGMSSFVTRCASNILGQGTVCKRDPLVRPPTPNWHRRFVPATHVALPSVLRDERLEPAASSDATNGSSAPPFPPAPFHPSRKTTLETPHSAPRICFEGGRKKVTWGYRRAIFRRRRRHLLEGPLYLAWDEEGGELYVTQWQAPLVPWCIRAWISVAFLCFSWCCLPHIAVMWKGGGVWM